MLGLVEVVGSSMVDIVAECGRHHGEGIQVRVVLPKFTRLRRETHIERESE